MNYLIYFFLCIAATGAWCSQKTIALNMIVKNESQVIRDCLESVKEWIDYWVIVDTGSTDGTQQIIHDVLKDIPGELLERPWIDFEHNRNDALEAARHKADYLLFIDADEKLSLASPTKKPLLIKDCYFITVKERRADYQRIFLVHTALPWKWEGVLHESIVCTVPKTFDLLEGVYLLSNTEDGFRSQDLRKYAKDAQILEDALRKDPTNTRYAFYLAQSYWNAGDHELALQWYLKRAGMGGWDQEIFWSLYQAAKLQEILGKPSHMIIKGYENAYQARQSRAEPLYYLANYYLNQNDPLLGYTVAKHALSLPLSQDNVFVETWIYKYGLWLTLANCSFELKMYKEAEEACLKALADKDLPLEIQMKVTNNLSLLNSLK